ncbi:MAG: FAD-dependent oxidoreductase, partial [Flavicella sp.]
MRVDYIIVGFGLAGLSFVDKLIENNKSFIVFEDASQTSSNVAGGVYNPVILKRFTPVWQAKEQLGIAIPFYEKLESKFSNSYDYKSDIFRIFKSIEEQNNWFAASDKPRLTSY